jgi:hypothetical protein
VIPVRKTVEFVNQFAEMQIAMGMKLAQTANLIVENARQFAKMENVKTQKIAQPALKTAEFVNCRLLAEIIPAPETKPAQIALLTAESVSQPAEIKRVMEMKAAQPVLRTAEHARRKCAEIMFVIKMKPVEIARLIADNAS